MSTQYVKNLEYKLFIMACIISMVVSFILFVIDTFVTKTYISSVIGVVSFIIFYFFYYQVKYKERFKIMLAPFIIILLILMNFAWFTGGGLNLTNSCVFLLILILTLIISPKSSRAFYLIVIFVNLGVFLALEFLYPAYSVQVGEKDELLIVNSIVIYMTFGITAFILIFFKYHYDRERNIVRKQNLELDASNSEIEAQNEELIQYQEEVMAQRDFIEEKNKMLELQAVELERVNEENQAINATLEKTVQERTKKLMDLNNDLDLLVYRSSHDFRRPLTTLMGLYEIARLTLKDELSRELFSKVNSTAQNMDKMLLKFFMLYNINHFRTSYEGNTLDEIIYKIDKNLISRKKDISFSHNISLDTYREKDARNSLIEIILENLVENSLIYHSKNHIDIHLEILEEDGNLKIFLEDNGNGIPIAFRDKVFDMYFRGSTLSTGNGLGLYVAKRAADLLNATIEIKSKEDEFTHFEIVFKV